MRVHLLHPDRDFVVEKRLTDSDTALVQDLELKYVLEAMAGGDAYLRSVSLSALLQPVRDAELIRYRQEALEDCLRHPDVVRELYDLAVAATKVRRSVFTLALPDHPELELVHAVEMLTQFATLLESLGPCGRRVEEECDSPAFLGLAETIRRQLSPEYLELVRALLDELRLPHGLLFSAGTGPGGTVTRQVPRRIRTTRRRLRRHVLLAHPNVSFSLPERDEAGARALSELRARALNDLANIGTQAMENVQAFFASLRAETGFYLAGRNLVRALRELGVALCTPMPGPTVPPSADVASLVDPDLALRTGSAPVGFDIVSGSAAMILITGANHGGKSTALRALGTAQLMMQSGLPVAAIAYRAPAAGRVFTHWAREEDHELRHGKFDEELQRMSSLVDELRPGDLLLCNETFSSPSEAEGSQILLDVTRALVRSGVRVCSVTHLYDFAESVAADPDLRAVCLRAPRDHAGDRTYRLEPGPPLPTSFGVDLYDRVFGTDLAHHHGNPPAERTERPEAHEEFDHE